MLTRLTQKKRGVLKNPERESTRSDSTSTPLNGVRVNLVWLQDGARFELRQTGFPYMLRRMAMAKTFVYIQIAGVQQPAKIKADKVEQNSGYLNVLREGKQIGSFLESAVQGWWIQEEV